MDRRPSETSVEMIGGESSWSMLDYAPDGISADVLASLRGNEE